MIQNHSKESAQWLREQLSNKTMKQENLTEEQKQLLTDYPEEQKN